MNIKKYLFTPKYSVVTLIGMGVSIGFFVMEEYIIFVILVILTSLTPIYNYVEDDNLKDI